MEPTVDERHEQFKAAVERIANCLPVPCKIFFDPPGYTIEDRARELRAEREKQRREDMDRIEAWARDLMEEMEEEEKRRAQQQRARSGAPHRPGRPSWSTAGSPGDNKQSSGRKAACNSTSLPSGIQQQPLW